MLAFRVNQTLFTHTIAARDINDACRVVSDQFKKQGIEPNGDPIGQWHTPDVWTRRAVDMALAPGIIDTIPRFVVDRKDGPVYVDIDDIHKASRRDRLRWRDDSSTHDYWLDACIVEHERGDTLKSHILTLLQFDYSDRQSRRLRALAGAWGLGPIPEWHAAILPALIALDIEAPTRGYVLADNVFELDREELWQHLHAQLPDTDDDINHLVELIARGTNLSLREYALRTLVSLGWLR